MDTEGAAAFWSYTHDDNAAEGERIVQLAHDLQAQYGVLTGGKLRLFLDRDEIGWGDDLRARIDEALADTTFFIPIITPRYFQHTECRRELIAFSQETKRLKVESLLLPIYYVDVPELSAQGDPSDNAMQIVKVPKYEDWRSLCLEDLHSSEYRKGVRKLAQRLVDVVRDLTTQPPTPADDDKGPSPATKMELEHTAKNDEQPGLLELLAEGEEAQPEWIKTAEALSPEITALGTLASEASEEMKKSDSRGGGAGGRLKVAIRLAEKMRPHADAIHKLGQENAAILVKIDPAINTMIDEIEADPKTAFETEGIPGFMESIQSMARNGKQAVESLQGLSTSLDQSAGFSRALRPPIRDIQSGLRGFMDAQAIYDTWDKRIDDIQRHLDAESPRTVT
jgi:TIR domain